MSRNGRTPTPTRKEIPDEIFWVIRDSLQRPRWSGVRLRQLAHPLWAQLDGERGQDGLSIYGQYIRNIAAYYSGARGIHLDKCPLRLSPLIELAESHSP